MHLTDEDVASYHEDGFLFLPNYFSPEEVNALTAEVPRLFAENTPRRILERSGAVRTVFAAHHTNETFNRLSRLHRLVVPAMQLLDSSVYIHQFKINAKTALGGDQWEWHQDFLYWHKEDGMPAPRVVTAAIFLHEAHDFNGPILVIPGSHKEGMVDVMPHEGSGDGFSASADGQTSPVWMSTLTADLKYKINPGLLSRLVDGRKIYPAKGPAGSVLFFHGNVFHASANNLSPQHRVTVFISYNSTDNKLAEVSQPRPTFIASRNFNPLEPVPDDALLSKESLHV